MRETEGRQRKPRLDPSHHIKAMAEQAEMDRLLVATGNKPRLSSDTVEKGLDLIPKTKIPESLKRAWQTWLEKWRDELGPSDAAANDNPFTDEK